MNSNTRRSRGVSLVEALVALAIMAFGMMAYVGVQNTLRLNGDVARQRSEATRIAQEALDALRSFTVVETTFGQRAWADIASQPPQTVAGLTTNTSYLLTQGVTTSGSPPIKTLAVTVRWEDRAGQAQQLVLSSVIAAAPPGLSGVLAVAPGTSPIRHPSSRHPTIPFSAKDLGNGRSVFRPDARVGWVFDNVTGSITGICELEPEVATASLTAAGLADCSSNTLAQFVTGFIRFKRRFDNDDHDLTAADAENPPGPALNLDVRLTLTSSGHPADASCFDDAPSTDSGSLLVPFVTYNCIVPSNTLQLWSGRTNLEPRRYDDLAWFDWRIVDSGNETGYYKVCRYTPAASSEVAVPNIDHPADYTHVAGNLTNQNFLVIPAHRECPTDVAANPALGDFVNTNTLQHQPEPD